MAQQTQLNMFAMSSAFNLRPQTLDVAPKRLLNGGNSTFSIRYAMIGTLRNLESLSLHLYIHFSCSYTQSSQTDSHGWLEGHLKEQNYGADWGDFATFSRRMKQAARDMDVDMLLVDTGDLHDSNGLSDATKVDGTKSMPIFNEIEYDLLTIGNHELYMAEVSYEMFNVWAK